MFIAHSCAEATRFISLLAATARRPSFDWAAGLLVSLMLNVLGRCGLLAELAQRVLPSWLGSCAAWTPAWVLHQEGKYAYGYPRFVPVLSLAAARLFIFGTEVHPFFNHHCVVLVVAVLLGEMAEDSFVRRFSIASVSRLVKHKRTYSELDAFHPRQVFTVDCMGLREEHVCLSLHGVRRLYFRDCFGSITLACLFAYSALCMSLGAGYLHGRCAEPPLFNVAAIVDGLFWMQPLRCESA